MKRIDDRLNELIPSQDFVKSSDLDDVISQINVPDPGIFIIPNLDDDRDPVTGNDNIFAPDHRKAWNQGKTDVARCDFQPNRHGAFIIGDFIYHSVWKKSEKGMSLVDIKAAHDMRPRFAKAVADLIAKSIGQNLDPQQFAIITAPKRRHKTQNFASAVAEIIAEIIGVPFFDDVCFCNSKMRVNAVFTPADSLPAQKNLIVFDDIVTTGSTLTSIFRLFNPLGYNLSFFVGIRNH